MADELISVLIPCRNHAEHLADCLNSIRQQATETFLSDIGRVSTRTVPGDNIGDMDVSVSIPEKVSTGTVPIDTPLTPTDKVVNENRPH